MTDLTGKFGGLGDQLATQHAETIAGLNSILALLGSQPPAATATLDDILSAITQSNVILNGIRSDMNAKLTNIFDTIDIMNNNASLNAQRIIQAVIDTSCPCDTTSPLLPLEPSETPLNVTNILKCQRIQAFVDLFAGWAVDIAAYIGLSGYISSFQVNNLLQLHLIDLDIETGQLRSGIPTSTRDLISNRVFSKLGEFGSAGVNAAMFNAMTNSSVKAAMVAALYANDNAAEAMPDVLAALASSASVSPVALPILQAMFYSAWPNDIYSSVPVLDASAYDGSVCSPDLGEISDCLRFDSQIYTNQSGTYHVVTSDPVYAPNAIFTAGDFFGYTVKLLAYGGGTQIRVDFYHTGGTYNAGSLMTAVGNSVTLTQHTAAIGIHTNQSNQGQPFSIELCPPGAS